MNGYIKDISSYEGQTLFMLNNKIFLNILQCVQQNTCRIRNIHEFQFLEVPLLNLSCIVLAP